MKYFRTYKLRLVVLLLISLITSCSSDDVVGPDGDYTYEIDEVNTLKVSFDAFGHGETVLWDFGDGETSTSLHPVHTYPQGGDYNVKLTIAADNGDTQVTDKVISVVATPVPSFDYTSSSLELTFYNTSLQSASYVWDFGDGETSTEENPVHAYDSSGAYTVTLTATNDDGSISKTTTKVVTAWSGPIIKLTGELFGHSGSWGDNPETQISAAVDGDVTTFVDGPGPEGWVGYDFGAGNKATLKSVKYAPRDGWGWRMVGAEIRGSNDPAVLTDPNATYTTLYKITEEPPSGELTTADVAAQEGYDFEGYRFIYFYTPDGYGNIAELEFTGVLN